MAARLETVRAKIGATFLDVIRPGWFREINLSTLRMASCQACVLGQLYGDYWKGAETLFALRANGNKTTKFDTDQGSHQAAIEAGFHNGDNDTVKYGTLTDSWKREINKRLNSKPAPARLFCNDCGHYRCATPVNAAGQVIGTQPAL